MAQTLKNLLAMWKTLVGSLGGEDPIPVFLPGESPWTGSLVGCNPWGWKESDTTEQLSMCGNLRFWNSVLFFK